MKIDLKDVRIAFPQLFVAKQVNGEGEAAFSGAFIFAKGNKHPANAQIAAGVEVVGKAKWKEKWPAVKRELMSKDRLPVHDGDGKPDYAGFAGNNFISARNKTRPTIVDRDRSELTAQDGKPYAGCYVVGKIELWAQDNKFGRRINASLRGVQFLRDGEAFSGSAPATGDEFEDLSNTGGEDNPPFDTDSDDLV